MERGCLYSMYFFCGSNGWDLGCVFWRFCVSLSVPRHESLRFLRWVPFCSDAEATRTQVAKTDVDQRIHQEWLWHQDHSMDLMDVLKGNQIISVQVVFWLHTVDGSEILHQLGCIKPCNWGRLSINWCRIFFNQQYYSITVFEVWEIIFFPRPKCHNRWLLWNYGLTDFGKWS